MPPRKASAKDAAAATPREIVNETTGVNASSKSPLYYQIYLILRADILSGVRKDGEIVPSEFELARLYNVSRITAKRALAELALAGLANRYRGRGTVVSYTPHNPPLRASVENWLHSASAMGRTTKVRMIEFGYGPASDEEAEALQIPVGEPVQRSVRVRLLEDRPFSLLSTVVPADIGKAFDAKELASTPLLALLERSGITVHHARQAITATLANQAHAELVETEIGAPLLKVQRIVFDVKDRPVEYLTALYRPDRYQLEMILSSEQTVTVLGDPIRGGVFDEKGA